MNNQSIGTIFYYGSDSYKIVNLNTDWRYGKTAKVSTKNGNIRVKGTTTHNDRICKIFEQLRQNHQLDRCKPKTSYTILNDYTLISNSQKQPSPKKFVNPLFSMRTESPLTSSASSSSSSGAEMDIESGRDREPSFSSKEVVIHYNGGNHTLPATQLSVVVEDEKDEKDESDAEDSDGEIVSYVGTTETPAAARPARVPSLWTVDTNLPVEGPAPEPTPIMRVQAYLDRFQLAFFSVYDAIPLIDDLIEEHEVPAEVPEPAHEDNNLDVIVEIPVEAEAPAAGPVRPNKEYFKRFKKTLSAAGHCTVDIARQISAWDEITPKVNLFDEGSSQGFGKQRIKDLRNEAESRVISLKREGGLVYDDAHAIGESNQQHKTNWVWNYVLNNIGFSDRAKAKLSKKINNSDILKLIVIKYIENHMTAKEKAARGAQRYLKLPAYQTAKRITMLVPLTFSVLKTVANYVPNMVKGAKLARNKKTAAKTVFKYMGKGLVDFAVCKPLQVLALVIFADRYLTSGFGEGNKLDKAIRVFNKGTTFFSVQKELRGR